MKIYQVHCHGDRFQTMNFVDWPTEQEYRDFFCEKKQTWDNNLMYIANTRKPKGDFYATSLDVLICNDRAYRALFSILFTDSCQILPVRLERSEESFHLINLLDCCNALDYDKTVWRLYDDGVKGSIKEPHFLKNRIGSSSTLFKIPEFKGGVIFTFTDPSIAKEETFKGLYEMSGLTGLDFYLTWSDENDGEKIELKFF